MNPEMLAALVRACAYELNAALDAWMEEHAVPDEEVNDQMSAAAVLVLSEMHRHELGDAKMAQALELARVLAVEAIAARRAGPS